MQTHFQIYSLNENAVTIEFGNQISESLLNQVGNFNQTIKQNPFPGLHATVPAYATLTVFYDVLTVHRSAMPGDNCFEKVSNYLNSLDHESATNTITENTVTIPVCYSGNFAPDIEEVAQLNQLTTDEVIQLHSQAVYKVYMIGFVPGFAYLGGMDARLATPRKTTPRKAVPAGAVGIAGEQTGIYPLQTPGGWQIIGQTPLTLFNAYRDEPSLLKAGDSVVFKPISTEEFNHLSQPA